MICDVSVEAGTGRSGASPWSETAIARLIGTLFALRIPVQPEKMTELPPLCQELKPEVILKGC